MNRGEHQVRREILGKIESQIRDGNSHLTPALSPSGEGEAKRGSVERKAMDLSFEELVGEITEAMNDERALVALANFLGRLATQLQVRGSVTKEIARGALARSVEFARDLKNP